MPFALEPFADAGLTSDVLDVLIDRHERSTLPRLELFWTYYRNPMGAAPSGAMASSQSADQRPYRLGQERGLPPRIVGARRWRSWGGISGTTSDSRGGVASGARKEVVIENDIAWRLHTMVDFMFGRPIKITSTARDEKVRPRIERILERVWETSGGIGLLQDAALLGHVYGHVDLIVRGRDEATERRSDEGEEARVSEPTRDTPSEDDLARRAAELVRIEIADPTRGIALLSPADYRRIDAYILRIRREVPVTRNDRRAERVGGQPASWWRRWLEGTEANISASRAPQRSSSASADSTRTIIITEILTADLRRVYMQASDDPDAPARLIEEGPSLIAPPREQDAAHPTPPVVHIQNISQPMAYEGLGEVEPLIPLQDELNTRLSDRASRVTMQSFKMYLAKGLDTSERIAIGPGQVWLSENPQASVEAFGGDGASPSEDAHIAEVREALDKASSVPPLATGVVRAKIGNLTSENALRVTLLGLLTKTARKRITYGRGIVQASQLILEALDRAGILHTTPDDRALRVDWPDPLPRDEREALTAAQQKIDLGVPRERVLGELGYAPEDPGLT